MPKTRRIGSCDLLTNSGLYFVRIKLTSSLLTFLILIVGQFLNAQPPTIQWQKSFGGSYAESAHAVAVDYDGFILAGSSASNDIYVSGHHGSGCVSSSCEDVWLVKTDFNGNIMWEMSYGGYNHDEAYSVITTSDSGYLACGITFSNDGDVTGNHAPQYIDAWVIKTDHFGNLLWQKCYGGSGPEYAYSVIETKDGGFAFCGYAQSNDGDVVGHHGDSTTIDNWVVKIDSIGNIQWQRCLGGSGPEEIGHAIIQLHDGSYAVYGIAGSIDGDVIGLHGNRPDCWFVKLDSVGNLINQNCYGGYLDAQIGWAMDTTFDGGYIFAGISSYDTGLVTGYHGNSGNWSGDAWIVKIDSSGNVEHEKCFGGTMRETIGAIKQTVDGGYIFTGLTSSVDGDIVGSHGWPDIYVIKIDTAFNIQWEKCLGGSAPDESFDIIQTNDSGFIIAGYTLSNDGDVTSNHGISDLWMVKLSSDPLLVNENTNSGLYAGSDYNREKGTIQINTSVNFNTDLNIELFDITGKQLHESNLNVKEGKFQFEIFVGQINTGLYLLRLTSNKMGAVSKLIIN